MFQSKPTLRLCQCNLSDVLMRLTQSDGRLGCSGPPVAGGQAKHLRCRTMSSAAGNVAEERNGGIPRAGS